MKQYQFQDGSDQPVLCRAYQLPPSGVDVPDDFHDWCRAVGFTEFESGRDETMEILPHRVLAFPSDWIVNLGGVFSPWRPEDFRRYFREVNPLPARNTLTVEFGFWQRIKLLFGAELLVVTEFTLDTISGEVIQTEIVKFVVGKEKPITGPLAAPDTNARA